MPLQSICTFIDVSRPPIPTSSTQRAAPILSPLTAKGVCLDPAQWLTPDHALSDDLIALVRSPKVDPNFLEVTARDASELRAKLRGIQGSQIRARQSAITHYLNLAKDKAAASSSADDLKEVKDWAQMVATLEQKRRDNQALMDIMYGDVDEERQLEYFEASRAAWTVHLPATLAKLEVAMVGPYALGDDPVRVPLFPARQLRLCNVALTPVHSRLLRDSVARTHRRSVRRRPRRPGHRRRRAIHGRRPLRHQTPNILGTLGPTQQLPPIVSPRFTFTRTGIRESS